MSQQISPGHVRRLSRRAIAVARARPAPRGLVPALALCGLADLAYLILTHLPR